MEPLTDTDERRWDGSFIRVHLYPSVANPRLNPPPWRSLASFAAGPIRVIRATPLLREHATDVGVRGPETRDPSPIPAQSGSIRLLLSHPRGLRQEEDRICRNHKLACVPRSTLDASRSTNYELRIRVLSSSFVHFVHFVVPILRNKPKCRIASTVFAMGCKIQRCAVRRNEPK